MSFNSRFFYRVIRIGRYCKFVFLDAVLQDTSTAHNRGQRSIVKIQLLHRLKKEFRKLPSCNSSSISVLRTVCKTKLYPRTNHNLLTISTRTGIRTKNRSFDTMSYSLFDDNWIVKENFEAIKGMQFFFNEHRWKFPGHRIKIFIGPVNFLYAD